MSQINLKIEIWRNSLIYFDKLGLELEANPLNTIKFKFSNESGNKHLDE